MAITRRQFLGYGSAGMTGALFAARWAHAAAFVPRISACDWSMNASGPDGLAIAKRIGLDGLEISAGGEADRLQIADPAYRQQYKAAMQATGLPVTSIAMGLLNNAPLASEPRGPVWLEQTIEAAADLNAKVILLAFFGKGDLRDKNGLKAADIDAVVGRIKGAAPKAEKAGVILGIENTLSGKDNAVILERIQSNAVRLYYDIGNSTYNDYDVAAELREFKDLICQIHFKDGGHFLGEGDVEMPPIAKAIVESGYQGWIVLETAIRNKDRDGSFQRNAEFVRKLFASA